MTASLGTLLVVDDEEFNRDMLGRRLQLEGFDIVAVASGAEALARIREQAFDAVLLDVMMPVQNGYEVLAEIRQAHSSLDLPVLMVTAKTQNEDVVTAFEAGANDYISKPINFPVALARINCHVASKKLSSRLRESETRYSLSAQGANDGLWDWNLLTQEVFYSDRWKSMLGYADEQVGTSIDEWFDRVHAEDLPHVQRALAAHRRGETQQFESEHRMRHQDQTYRWVLTRGVAIRDAGGREIRMAGSQTDITRGKAADPLTGLPNRVLFMDHVESALHAAKASPDSLFAVLFLDLDRFKIINDSLGHHVGDELLVSVARRLESCLRSTDAVSRVLERCTVARFGGDEFVILLRGLTAADNATAVAARILRALSESWQLQGHDVTVSASIGIALGDAQTTSADDLIRDADTAMYQAKTHGKSQWRLFDPSMRARVLERLSLESELRRGLKEHEFFVHYQPIVDLHSQQIRGVEALLRWNHPVRGLVMPAEFIPVAEETGFIVELGGWVLREACGQLRTWRDDLGPGAPQFVSVNVSAAQFSSPELVDQLISSLEHTRLDPACVKLEITESAIMRNPEAARHTLEELRQVGVSISLDDFGTGYSSLSYLQHFPIDTLKIDRSFVDKLEASPQSRAIVRTIVALAHSLGMQVTAEGVEKAGQQSILGEIACEHGQGYLYSRPIPHGEIETLLREQAAVGQTSDAAARPARSEPALSRS